MKKIKFLMLVLVAAFGFTACEKDCDHEFIEYDYSKALVGTWTYVSDDGLAEAMVIKEDGSFAVIGIMEGGSSYEVKGTVKVVNNKVYLAYEGDTEVFDARLELVAGKSMSIVFNDENDIRLTYDYCKEDLSEEIVGMWVCNDGLTDGITIMSYSDNGKSTMTTANALGTSNPLVNMESDYVVVGDLVFMTLPNADVVGSEPKYTAARMIYTPNGTSAGDIMTHKKYIPSGNDLKESVMSFLRVKQNLELHDMKYDYMKTFVTNVKGEDKDIPFLNTSFNFAKMDGSIIDKFLKSTLFAVEFPDANTLKYSFLVNGQTTPMTAPVEVEGNKMTIKMSANGAAFQDVVVYTFQDKDNTQMHLYMPTSSFEKFFANTSVYVMLGNGQLDINDTEAIAGVYKTVADAVESINLSLVMTKSTKSL